MNKSLLYLKDSHILFVNKVNLECNYSYLYPYFSAFFNYKSEEYLGTPAIDTVIVQDRELCEETIRKCLAAPNIAHPVILRKPLTDGNIIHTQWEITFDTELKE